MRVKRKRLFHWMMIKKTNKRTRRDWVGNSTERRYLKSHIKKKEREKTLSCYVHVASVEASFPNYKNYQLMYKEKRRTETLLATLQPSQIPGSEAMKHPAACKVNYSSSCSSKAASEEAMVVNWWHIVELSVSSAMRRR